MPLSHRPAAPQDLDACWRIVRGDSFYPPALRETRTAFWRRLMAEEAALSVVVEDFERPLETRLRAFSLSAFVTDAFAAEARAALPPGIDSHLHAQTLAGASPILGHAAIGRANARGGLTLVINPFGYASDGSDADLIEAAEMMFGCLFSYHAGYQIKELLVENYLWEWAVRNIAAGLRTRTQYAADPAARPNAAPTPQPTLLGLTREEAFASLGNRFFPLFVCSRPRFGFRRSEQRLLSHALRGGTNEESAQALNVSLSAVKKCWEAIYSRVAETAPELLFETAPELLFPQPYDAPLGRTRGVGKKDHLLAYLRQHPEELRPYQP